MYCNYCKKEKEKVYTVKAYTVKSGKKHTRKICSDCHKEKIKNYASTTKGKKAINEASKRAYMKHKVKWIARAKARYAVKKGILTKPKWCEVCNLVKPLQGHHEDYTKPLEVIWLCTNCHADADKILEASPQQ